MFTAGRRLSCSGAWERKVQVDAASKAKELFPNLADADMELTTEIIGRLLDEPGAEDPEAGYDGVPFTQTENEDEFLDWIDWDNLAA